MKLYTEEEIKRGLDNPISFDMTTDEFINSLTPIELPTDEEIVLEIKSNIYISDDCDFRQGIEFLINKIQLGNK